MSATPSQFAVLRWLIAYPRLRIHCQPCDGARPYWSAKWRTEEARKQMVEIIGGVFGGDDGRADSIYPTSGGSPRLTDGTFRALIRRGWIRAVEVRKRGGVMSAMNYFQITEAGEKAAMIQAPRAGMRGSDQ